MNAIFSTGEVGRLLRIQPYRITYAITSGQLPEASFRFLGKRCFSEADIAKIADHFGVEPTHLLDTQKENE